jgi:hypothetical protein
MKLNRLIAMGFAMGSAKPDSYTGWTFLSG